MPLKNKKTGLKRCIPVQPYAGKLWGVMRKFIFKISFALVCLLFIVLPLSIWTFSVNQVLRGEWKYMDSSVARFAFVDLLSSYNVLCRNLLGCDSSGALYSFRNTLVSNFDVEESTGYLLQRRAYVSWPELKPSDVSFAKIVSSSIEVNFEDAEFLTYQKLLIPLMALERLDKLTLSELEDNQNALNSLLFGDLLDFLTTKGFFQQDDYLLYVNYFRWYIWLNTQLAILESSGNLQNCSLESLRHVSSGLNSYLSYLYNWSQKGLVSEENIQKMNREMFERVYRREAFVKVSNFLQAKCLEGNELEIFQLIVEG